jgi:ABC-type sugar transport system permease subunit
MKALTPQAKSTATCYGIILPSVVLLLLFVYAPVVWAIVSSFYQFEIGGDPRRWRWKGRTRCL